MINKHFLLAGLFLMSFNSFSQKEINSAMQKAEFLVKPAGNMVHIEGPYMKHPLFYTKGFSLNDGKIQIYNRCVRAGMLKSDKNAVFGINITSGLKLVPSLAVTSFSMDLKSTGTNVETIHLYDTWKVEQPYWYNFDTPDFKNLGSSKTDKRMEQLGVICPVAIEKFSFSPTETQENRILMSGYSVYTAYSTKTIFSGYDPKDMKPKIEKKASQYRVDLSTLNPNKLVLHPVEIYNPQSDQWTIGSAERLEGKENKRSEYRNYHMITTNKDGKVVNDVKIDFPFTKNPDFFQFVANDQNPSDSKILIFWTRRVFMNKFNDPDELVYDVTVLNADGSLDFNQSFKYGEKAYQLSVVNSFINNGKINFIGEELAGLSLFEATKDGVKQISEKTKAVVGPNTEKLSNTWKVYGSKVVNGNLFIWGEEKRDATPIAGQPVDPNTNYISYHNLAIIQIDLPSSKIVTRYTFDLKERDVRIPFTIDDYFETDNKIIFLTNNVKRTFNDQDRSLNKLNFFENTQFYAEKGMDNHKITRPFLLSVNYRDKKAATYTVSSPDYINLYPKKSYIKEGNTLYFVGIKDDKVEGEVTYNVFNVALDE